MVPSYALSIWALVSYWGASAKEGVISKCLWAIELLRHDSEPTALAAGDRRSNRSSSINLPLQNNFQFNLCWNKPNPCTLQTSRPAASAVG